MESLLERNCEICKTLSNKNRLKILSALRDGSKTVTELVHTVKISQSAISQHLAMMKDRGILETEREGTFIRYRLRHPEIMDAFDILEKITEDVSKEKK